MDANTNPGTHPGLRWPDFATVADISRGFAEHVERCRNLPAVQEGAQWAELSVRIGAFEGKLENLDTKIQHLDANIQRLKANVNLIVNKLDGFVNIPTTRSTEMNEKFAKCDTKFYAV
ncbi:hypothetical protein E4U09_008232 [Claviceps aff. purpurea]|uniref:Uncharacterized protein n=1 Tax=Claviceps aff. purpurea TaxID=1967640 RepID=A0A9P7QDX3_9HYPO|nr:hypothetical protein E4U09_008232 [Claviceps aff. purpurea]